MKKNKYLISMVVSALLVAVIIGFVTVRLLTSPRGKTENVGFIEGKISYPSEGIPLSMKIFAENIDTKELFSISIFPGRENEDHLFQIPKGDKRLNFRIKVAPGRYYVYARTKNTGPAYYSQFVLDGLRQPFNNHNPIVVTVKAGDTKKHIDPQDWYAPDDYVYPWERHEQGTE